MKLRYCVLFFLVPIDAFSLPCQLAEYSINLSCKISANFKSVSLIDDHGKDVARCALKGQSGNCSSEDFIKPVIGENVVKFYVHRNRTTSLHGNWFCSHENIMFKPEILSSKDATDSTIVNLEGTIVHDDDAQRLLLTCSSCRIPDETHAEFLMNGNSVDSLTYKDATGKCTNSYGECSSGVCNCSSSGNAFSRYFVLKKHLNTETHFSCDMRFHFEDKEHVVFFSKVSTLSFNGKDFQDRGTRTYIIKSTDILNRPKDKDNNTANILIPVISASVIMVIILLTVAIYCNRKEGRLEKKKEKKIAFNEGTPLLEQEQVRIQLEDKDRSSKNSLKCGIDRKHTYNKQDRKEDSIQLEYEDRSTEYCLKCGIDLKDLYTKPDTSDKTFQVTPEDFKSPDDEVYVQASDDLTQECVIDIIETESNPSIENNEDTDDEDFVEASDNSALEESILKCIEKESKSNNENDWETDDEDYFLTPECLTGYCEPELKPNNDQARIKEDMYASYMDFPYPSQKFDILNKSLPTKVTEDIQRHMKRGSCHGNIKPESLKSMPSFHAATVEVV